MGRFSIVSSLPGLSRYVGRRGLRTEPRHDLPDRVRRQDTAVRRHAAWAAVEDRLEDLAVRAAVAPAAIDEAGTDEPRPATAVTAVAVHRGEHLAAFINGPAVISE